MPPKSHCLGRPTWFVYVVRLHPLISRDSVASFLKEQGIQTAPYLPAIHLQKLYIDLFGFTHGTFPMCEEVSASTLALPFYIGLTQEDIQKICKTLDTALEAQL